MPVEEEPGVEVEKEVIVEKEKRNPLIVVWELGKIGDFRHALSRTGIEVEFKSVIGGFRFSPAGVRIIGR